MNIESWTTAAVLAQIVLTVYFAVTHWISLPPFNHLAEEAFANEQRINLALHLIQLISIAGFFYQITWLMILGVAFWTVWLIGHICSWWLPYFFGVPKVFLENAVADNAKTLHFLPARLNHPIPDVNHTILGVLSVVVVVTTWSAVHVS